MSGQECGDQVGASAIRPMDVAATAQTRGESVVAVTTKIRLQPCPQGSIGTKRARWAVDRGPGAVPALRANVLKVLQSWDFARDDDQAFAATLVLTEMVTNASRYGRPVLGLIDVDMWLEGSRITVVVTDGAAEAPVVRESGAEDESGRGLRLISAYAEASGYEPHRTGKRVWAVIGPQPAPEIGVVPDLLRSAV
ncbi:ATP-binding protein [Kitasatospora sp. NPDC004723]|uniref:ATP-binding protein n=1 Tax=Kitasatospora sp. NPDC004723 TaxID=3154288 RepID=UPI0033B0DFD7